MSSPPRNSENAAPATLVSPAHSSSSSTPSTAVLNPGSSSSSSSRSNIAAVAAAATAADLGADVGTPTAAAAATVATAATPSPAYNHHQQQQQQQQQHQQQQTTPEQQQQPPPPHPPQSLAVPAETPATAAAPVAVLVPALPQPSPDTPPSQAAAAPPVAATVTAAAAVTQHQQDVDPNIKKPRGPAALPRQSGPSLLTQALASARGIPSRTSSSTDQQHVSQLSTRSLPSPTTDSTPFHPPSAAATAAAGLDSLVVDPRHVFSHAGNGASLITQSGPPSAFAASSPAATSTIDDISPTTVTTHAANMEIMTSPTYDISSFQGIRAMLMDHREFLRGTQSRGRGSSLERADRVEPKVQPGLRKTRAHSHSTSPEGSLAASVANLDQRLQMDGTSAAAADAVENTRPKKLEKRFSVGPEKIWSIGSSEAIDGQEDGQVEKSVHEAMIGAEPNARSRKASYSLRFFREGLPKEEKTRRKETRQPQPREKPSPNLDSQEGGLSADIAIEDFAAKSSSAHNLPSPRILEKKDWQPKKLERVKTLPLQSPQAGETPVLMDSPTQDYFGLRKVNGDIFHKVDSDAVTQAGVKEGGSQDQLPSSAIEKCRATEARRPSADSSDHGESHEEGDESSEEKISSAVFVPHPALEEAAECEREISKPRQTPSARTASRAEDFHPWLVKADEPEPEEEPCLDQPPDTPSHKPKPKRLPGEPNVALREVQPGEIHDLAADDEPEPPTPKKLTSQLEDHTHHHQSDPKEPLEAIELIPYKHQVGGHTTLWRFSKRAVCKQLNNRENEFYERVEQHHRDLLTFLPRYIGVLNVTFHKQPRRKSTHKREDVGVLERRHTGDNNAATPITDQSKSNGSNGGALTANSNGGAAQGNQEHRRIISQSLASTPMPIPTVTFDDNWHILPRNLIQPTSPPTDIPTRGRSTSSSGLPHNSEESKVSSPTRPSLDDRHANSWGATTVNKRLRNEVFNDAFLKQPIPIHKHRRPHQKQMAFRKQQTLRPANSVPDLMRRQESMQENHAPQNPSPLRPSTSDPPTVSMTIDHHPGQAEPAEPEDQSDVKDVTGTSAPEPETLADKIIAQKKKRRYSGTGLRRKPRTVTESRGNLKYWEEADDAGYRGEDEEPSGQSVTTSRVNSPMIEPPDPNGATSGGGIGGPGIPAKELSFLPEAAADASLVDLPTETGALTQTSLATLEGTSPTQEFRKIPRPVNPKEAQTQRNSRVEYFLLLEDLTAGMKRPCIMDLKMGTRQYGVDATPKKKKSQQGKCARTTSRQLGVRVCGLQVWDVKSQSYVFKDKYFGRDLKAGQEFQDALTRFLYDGVDYGSILRHIPTILRKLDRLESIVRGLDGYRFYAASLLMFYDGDTTNDDNEDDNTVVDDSTTDFATDTEETSAMRDKRRRKKKREIDFKIADFANSLTKGDLAQGKPCPPQHPNEPDRGFLRGLRTLRKYFLKIQRDIRAEMGLDPGGRHSSMDDIDIDHLSDDDEGPVSE